VVSEFLEFEKKKKLNANTNQVAELQAQTQNTSKKEDNCS